MTLGSLFAGIGGFELGALKAGVIPVWSNEINSECCNWLRENFTHDIIETDIRNCGKGREYELASVDIVCGGFPCQPFSQAGKRKGSEDNRYLWPEMLRVIKDIRPRWVVAENVPGILTLENGKIFEKICSSLENEGYKVWPFNIPIGAIGAWTRRERIWIIAHSDIYGNNQDFTAMESSAKENEGKTQGQNRERNRLGFKCLDFKDVKRNDSYAERNRLQKGYEFGGYTIEPPEVGIKGFECEQWDTWDCPPEFPLLAYGLSEKLDEPQTIALGNAIAPQLAEIIFKIILEVDRVFTFPLSSASEPEP